VRRIGTESRVKTGLPVMAEFRYQDPESSGELPPMLCALLFEAPSRGGTV
jgi:hypothetical protein